MNLPAKFSIVFPVGGLLLSFSLFALLAIGYNFSLQPKKSASAKVYYPAATPIVTNTEPQKINQVSVLSAFAEALTKTTSSEVPFAPINTPTPTSQSLPSFYTELTTKGLVANVTDSSFSVIWLTEAPQPTALRLGTSSSQLTKTIFDDTRTTQSTYLHFSTAMNLKPENTYYYSGPSPITNTFTLPKTIPVTLKKQTISGTIAGNLPKSECLVFVHAAKTSGISSTFATISTQGTWQLSLEKLRTEAFDEYFLPSLADNITIEAFCIAQNKALYAGNASVAVKNALQKPTNITINKIAN